MDNNKFDWIEYFEKNPYWIGIFLFCVVNVVFYIIGAFTAWRINPSDWLIFKNEGGRFLFIILQILLAVKIALYVDEEF